MAAQWTILLTPLVFEAFMGECDARTLSNFLEFALGSDEGSGAALLIIRELAVFVQGGLRRWLRRQRRNIHPSTELSLDLATWTLWSMSKVLRVMHALEHYVERYYFSVESGNPATDRVVKLVLKHSKQINARCLFTPDAPAFLDRRNKQRHIQTTTAAFVYTGFADGCGILVTASGQALFTRRDETTLQTEVVGGAQVGREFSSIVKAVTHPLSNIGLFVDELFRLTVVHFGSENINVLHTQLRAVPEMVTEDCLSGPAKCFVRDDPTDRFWHYDGCTNVFAEHFVRLVQDPKTKEPVLQLRGTSSFEQLNDLTRIRPPPCLDIPRSKAIVICKEHRLYEGNEHLVVAGTRCSPRAYFYHYVCVFQNGRLFDREAFMCGERSLALGWCQSTDRRKLYVCLVTRWETVGHAAEMANKIWTSRAGITHVSRRKKGQCFCVKNYQDYNWIAIIEVDLEAVDFKAKLLARELQTRSRLRFFFEIYEKDAKRFTPQINTRRMDKDSFWATNERLLVQFDGTRLMCVHLVLGIDSTPFTYGGTEEPGEEFFFDKTDKTEIRFPSPDDPFDHRQKTILYECPELESRPRLSEEDRKKFRKRKAVVEGSARAWEETIKSRRKYQL